MCQADLLGTKRLETVLALLPARGAAVRLDHEHRVMVSVVQLPVRRRLMVGGWLGSKQSMYNLVVGK